MYTYIYVCLCVSLIKDDDVSNSINKVFDSEPIYNEKYLKTKVKSYEGKPSHKFSQ